MFTRYIYSASTIYVYILYVHYKPVTIYERCTTFKVVYILHFALICVFLFPFYLCYFYFIKPLSAIIDSRSIIHHSFADDIQLQMSAPPDGISEQLHSMQSCIGDVKAWATANMLRINDNKTELMLVTSKRTKHLHNLPTSITI